MNETTPALTLENLCKTYASGHEALKNISLIVQQGDFFALLGKNGAGKSTAIGIICSLINKSKGRVKIFDIDTDEDFPLAKSYLGIVPQEINFSIFETPLQVVVNQAGYYGIGRELALQRAEKYLRQLQLWDKRNNMTRELSGGMKRRLMIARALIHEPKLLILDEPTAGVDIEIRRTMWSFLTQLNQQGTTIILTTHYLEEAESLCRNIAIIDNGTLVENTSTRKLLQTLQQETYVLDLKAPLEALPTDGFEDCVLKEATLIEVTVKKSDSISNVFARLQNIGVVVESMRNKSNRLEQLFLDMVDNSPKETT